VGVKAASKPRRVVGMQWIDNRGGSCPYSQQVAGRATNPDRADASTGMKVVGGKS